MFSQIFVLSLRGDVIIAKNYRSDIGHRETAEEFLRYVREGRDGAEPIFIRDHITYIYLRRANMYFLLTTRFNVSPTLSVELLGRIVQVIKDYLGLLSEDTIRRNFPLVYEILDEVMVTATETLQPHVHNKSDVVDSLHTSGAAALVQQLKSSVTGGARTTSSMSSSRPVGDRSGKDEIFLDVLERVNVVQNSRGETSHCVIDGAVHMKSFVSGQPEMQVFLNPDLAIGSSGGYGNVRVDHVVFHDCANMSRFERERMVAFVPPEGEFIVMRYRASRPGLFTPFKMTGYLEDGAGQRLILTLRIRCDLPTTAYGQSLVCETRMPKDCISAQTETEGVISNMSSQAKDGLITWTIPRINGTNEVQLRVTMLISSQGSIVEARREVGPANLSFELPMYVCSGLDINKLQVIDRGRVIQPHRWVRYVTQSTSYVCRLHVS